jgi:hypothetical protein
MIISCPEDLPLSEEDIGIARMLLKMANEYPESKLEEVTFQRGIKR